VFGKSPVGAYIRVNHWMWNRLPPFVTACALVRSYGELLHFLVRMQSQRGQLRCTFFMRNPAALALIARLVERSETDTLRVAVLGCSTGAEAYSVARSIRSARPDMTLVLNAVDISREAVEVAKRGVYSFGVSSVSGTDVFDGMTQAEIDELFDLSETEATVKSWLRESIEWSVGDVRTPDVAAALGSQDIVVANNFLCHMEPSAAEQTLRNIARLVRPGGYLFVSGVDLSIRARVARDLGWIPIDELLEEIYHGDSRMHQGWPFNYCSVEPMNKRKSDWKLRYSAAFVLTPSSDSAPIPVQPSAVSTASRYTALITAASAAIPLLS